MLSDNNFNIDHEYYRDLYSFEEELLLNYDDYLKGTNFYSLKAENHYDLELDDLDKEYDENDWEEEENENYEEDENHEENTGEHETFLM